MRITVSNKSLYIASLWIYVFCVPLGALNIGSFGSLLKIIAIFPVIIALICTRSIGIHKLHGYYLGYVVISLLSLIWSINRPSTFGRACTLAELFLLMLSVNSIQWERKDIEKIKATLIWSSRFTVV